VLDDLVTESVELPSGDLRMLQPRVSAELPDVDGVEWAPVAPYWSIIWRSGVALARELDREALGGLRIVELGCGMAVPSIAAARAGATVLATDASIEALTLAERNACANDAPIETATIDWGMPDTLVQRAPFDLVVASDVLYERAGVAALLALLPRLAPAAWIADPGRSPAEAFFEQAHRRWEVDTRERGVVKIHRLQFETTSGLS
jgi:predicted nicotinamide N-methyase